MLTPDPPDYDITKALRNRLKQRQIKWSQVIYFDKHSMLDNQPMYLMKRPFMEPALKHYYQWLVGE